MHALQGGDISAAVDTFRAEYPFVAIVPEARRYTEVQSLRVFRRDGFIDRYSGQKLFFAGVLRLLSGVLPDEFPFHQNWKMAETHSAYWELFQPSTTSFPSHGAGQIARDHAEGELKMLAEKLLATPRKRGKGRGEGT